MNQRCIANETLGETGFHYTLSLINGKYKRTILYTRMEFGVVRFNEMKKYIGGNLLQDAERLPQGVGGGPCTARRIRRSRPRWNTA